MENSSISDYGLVDWGIDEVSKFIPEDVIVDVEPRMEISTGKGEGI